MPDRLQPSEGWGVVHLFVDAVPGATGATKVASAVEAFAGVDPQQVIAFSPLGGRADLGLMLLSPDLAELDRLTHAVLAGPFRRVAGYFSLTEQSEYTSTEDDERTRLEGEGVDDVDAKLAEWRERMASYLDARLHPRLPNRRLIAFYPMSKKRERAANWYALPFDERKRLMGGHARVGRHYAGRVLQLITGATGLDDWEWGVTLLADDPVAIKEIVYEMRFDPVSATYSEFGPFYTGLVDDASALIARLGG